jgi:hypothetical protein
MTSLASIVTTGSSRLASLKSARRPSNAVVMMAMSSGFEDAAFFLFGFDQPEKCGLWHG